MDNVALAKINTFGKSPKADFVSPSEQLITLTFGQLSDLITEAVEKAIQPLQDRIVSLEATVTRQDEKIAALESTQDTHADNSLIQLRLINDLREGVHRAAAPAPTKKTTSHIDQLHKLMLEEKSQQVSIAKAARLLSISKERMRLLKPMILKDGRFELSWSTIKGKKAVVIRIRKFL
jgi:uncharacterized coiled-coil protein SlyX